MKKLLMKVGGLPVVALLLLLAFPVAGFAQAVAYDQADDRVKLDEHGHAACGECFWGYDESGLPHHWFGFAEEENHFSDCDGGDCPTVSKGVIRDCDNYESSYDNTCHTEPFYGDCTDHGDCMGQRQLLDLVKTTVLEGSVADLQELVVMEPELSWIDEGYLKVLGCESAKGVLLKVPQEFIDAHRDAIGE